MKAILLHGTDGSSESNWLPWLKQQLEKHKITVYAPSLPNAAYPNGEAWSDFVIQNMPFEPNEDTIIIGHSAGAALIPMLLQKLPAEAKIRKAIFVSGFYTDLGWDKLKDLHNIKVDYNNVKRKCDDFIFLHSDNDPYVPLEEPRKLANNLNGKLTVIKGQGHFNLGYSPKYKEFPKLLAIILKNNALQNLYLASSFREPGVAKLIMDDIETLLGKSITEIQLSYITTAGNLHSSDKKGRIDDGRKIFQERGWQVFDYDIAGKTEAEVVAELNNKDVVFVQGGNNFYLLEQIQNCNFGKIIRNLLAKGVLYIGESAGAIVCSKNIRDQQYMSGDLMLAESMKDFTGLGLVNFLIKPHWNRYGEKREKFSRFLRETPNEFYSISQPIICLNDNQLIRVEGASFQIWHAK